MGHGGQHGRDPNERKEMRRLSHSRFYQANRERRVAESRAHRRRRTVLKAIIKTIWAREHYWKLRLKGMVLRMDGRIYGKPLTAGELPIIRMELERCADRYSRAPATAFLRLPVIR
jgi:hypothetical protein